MQTEFDVVVVGGGGSGLAAAYWAAERGGSVLVLEKRPQPGGTTGIAVGSFTAAGTGMQRAADVHDQVADHVEDAAKFAPHVIEERNNHRLRAFFLGEAAETFRWLEKLGLSFVGPNPEPPNRVPRMHNVVPGAKAYIASLQLALQRRQVKFACRAEVGDLLQNRDGRIRGVRCTIAGQVKEYSARRGVILAGGDYANNPELIARYKGDEFREIEGINPFATGEGHRLAERAGGELLNMDVTYGPELRLVPASNKPFQQWLPAHGPLARWLGAVARRLPPWLMQRLVKRLLVTWQHPEDALFDDGAILVNCEGVRFANETAWPAREIGVSRQTDKVAYVLLDGRLATLYSKWPKFVSTAPDIAYAYVRDYQKLRPDATHVGSLASVCAATGLNESSLRATIEEFNHCVAVGRQDRLGRKSDHQLLKSPWVLLGPVKAYFTTTEGGAAVDQRLRVLDKHGMPVPGLYAVGQNGLGGMILWGHGLHIAWALTSGRLAGCNVMDQKDPPSC